MADDLRRTIAAIRAAGGTVDATEIHVESERWAVFTDPDGNRLGIYQQAGGADQDRGTGVLGREQVEWPPR